MSAWKREELSAWQRAVAARARGVLPDEEDVAEARRRARPEDEPNWARQVAERAVAQSGQAPVEKEPKVMSEFERKIRRRLGAPVDDDAA